MTIPDLGSGLLDVIARTAVVYPAVPVPLPGPRPRGGGGPPLLVRRGRVLRRAMREESVSHAELLAALREHGLVRVEDVELAVLETTGAISVIPRPDAGGSGGQPGG